MAANNRGCFVHCFLGSFWFAGVLLRRHFQLSADLTKLLLPGKVRADQEGARAPIVLRRVLRPGLLLHPRARCEYSSALHCSDGLLLHPCSRSEYSNALYCVDRLLLHPWAQTENSCVVLSSSYSCTVLAGFYIILGLKVWTAARPHPCNCPSCRTG